MKLISSAGRADILHHSVNLNKDNSKINVSRNNSAEKFASGRDSQEYMTVIGRRKNTVSSPKRTPNRSPEPNEENFGKI